MKSYAIRLALFGLASSASVGLLAGGLAQLASFLHFSEIFALPFMFYVLCGIPLNAILDWVPGFSQLQWWIFPAGGLAAAFSFLIASAFATWAVALAFGRHLWNLKHRPAPNNSFKPKPLRGSA